MDVIGVNLGDAGCADEGGLVGFVGEGELECTGKGVALSAVGVALHSDIEKI